MTCGGDSGTYGVVPCLRRHITAIRCVGSPLHLIVIGHAAVAGIPRHTGCIGHSIVGAVGPSRDTHHRRDGSTGRKRRLDVGTVAVLHIEGIGSLTRGIYRYRRHGIFCVVHIRRPRTSLGSQGCTGHSNVICRDVIARGGCDGQRDGGRPCRVGIIRCHGTVCYRSYRNAVSLCPCAAANGYDQGDDAKYSLHNPCPPFLFDDHFPAILDVEALRCWLATQSATVQVVPFLFCLFVVAEHGVDAVGIRAVASDTDAQAS